MKLLISAVKSSAKLKMSALLLSMSVFTVVAFTYAWFVNTTDTEVSGAELSVDQVIALEIKEAGGYWTGSLSADVQSTELHPVSLADGVFKEAVLGREDAPSISYSDGSKGYRLVVKGYENIADLDSAVYIRDFQVRFPQDANLLLSEETTMSQCSIRPAIRVGIYENDGSGYSLRYIWLPDGDNDYTAVITSLTAWEPKDLRIIIWLEGSDEACTSASSGQSISFQIKFRIDL